MLYSPKQNPGQIERNKVSDFVTPWNSPGQKIGVGSLSLLQGILEGKKKKDMKDTGSDND